MNRAERAEKRNKQQSGPSLKYAGGALAAFLVLALVFAFSGKDEEPPAHPGRDAHGNPLKTESELKTILDTAPTLKPISPQEKVIEVITSYQEKIDNEPQSEEAPALLSAKGNLYRQKLGDYEKAANAYELLLIDYPNWEGIKAVYPALATCYERLQNMDEADQTYERMMNAFPKDSEEYKYAQAKLNRAEFKYTADEN